MKHFLAVLILLSTLPISATTYCVSNTGSDSNSGTATGPNCTGTVSAWQTIAYVNAQKFKPGDSILFQSGDVWREELSPSTSGNAGNPITFSSYGTGAKPIISGSDSLTRWSSTVSRQITSSLPANVYSTPVLMQPREVWFNEAAGVKESNIFGLIADKEWYWSAGTLYVYASVNPSSLVIEAGSRDFPIYVSNVNYLTVAGLEVKDANGADIYLRNSTNSMLESMLIHDSYAHGVYLGMGGGDHVVNNCEIYNAGITNAQFGNGNGIQTDDSLTVPSIFQNNYIHDLGNAVGGDHAIYDQSPGDVSRYNHFKNIIGSTGMKVDGNNAVIYGNVFDHISSGGVYIDAYSNVKVLNNTFYNVGTVSPYGGIIFNGDGKQSGVEFENNIFVVSGAGYSAAIVVNSNSTGFISDHNDVFGNEVYYGEWSDGQNYKTLADWESATGQDKHSIAKDPQFTDPTGSDFSLAGTSPARNAGVPISGYAFSYGAPDLGAVRYYGKAASIMAF